MAGKWLLKSDPAHYSFSDLVRDGQTVWDGVSNKLALKNLRTFRRGDVAIIYHTGTERAAVGLPEVLTDAYPDPKQKDPKLVVVDLRAKGRFAPAVTLDEIKKAATLKDFDLVRLPRLFVMSVSEAQCKAMVAMAAKPPA